MSPECTRRMFQRKKKKEKGESFTERVEGRVLFSRRCYHYYRRRESSGNRNQESSWMINTKPLRPPMEKECVLVEPLNNLVHLATPK
ncbi:hypothetical protein CDAR_605761 [Caerostris darwini]|uniref:Uncharacterized protein n=1 Tax=Caerostris darwini TaxID=1538125 RepID=A0AAV4UA33_9ARAC|nr:hypothetical protein CDAR_605761 [Caerostris darwini]